MSELIGRSFQIIFDSAANESSFRDTFGLPFVIALDAEKHGMWFKLTAPNENHNDDRFFIPWSHIIGLRSIEGGI